MTVNLVSTTMIDWANLIQSVVSATGRSPTRRLDDRARPIDHLPAYIATLDGIRNENSNPIMALQTAVSLLEHISLGFCIEATEKDFLKILEIHKGIASVTTAEVGVFTATLGIWKQAIVEASKPSYSKSVRSIFNQIFLIIRSGELSFLFSEYDTKKHRDGTLLLEHL